MNVRKARKDELKELQRLNEEVFIDNQKYDSDIRMDWPISDLGKKFFIKLLSNSKGCCLVAEEKGCLVGYLAATPRKFGSRKSKYIGIDNMGVGPDFRSKGVGSLLIAKLRKWAKKNGYDRIYVNAYFENLRAISFYKNSGFSEIDVSLERGV